MPPDEQPPKRIWLEPEEMERWWKKVEADRKRKYGVTGDDDDPGEEGIDYESNGFSLIARG